jgi:hypothetical protein
MASPSSAITRFDLSSTFSEFDFRLAQMGFIGTRVARPRIVGIKAGDAGKNKLKTYLRQSSQTNARAPGAGYRRDDYQFDKFSFNCQEYGKESPVDDAEVATYGDIVDIENIAAGRAENDVITEYEEKVAAKTFDTAAWTGSSLFLNVTNEWDDFTNADPEADVNYGREKIVANSGLEANALILNKFCYRNLCRCNSVRDVIKYTQTPTPQLMRSLIADMLDLDFILVAGGIHNTANDAQTTAVGRIWSNEYAMLARVAVTDDPKEPCAVRTHVWDGDGPTGVGTDERIAVVMEEYREEKVRGSIMRARTYYDINQMYVEAGFLFGNITT